MRNSRTSYKAGSEVIRNHHNGESSESNLDWLAKEEAYEDLLSPPTSLLRRETEDTKSLKERIEKLTLYLKRERATVAALQDRLIYEEETNARLRKRLESYENHKQNCPPLETKSTLVSNRNLNASRRRPPWNDDFSGSIQQSNEQQKQVNVSQRSQEYKARPPWNNDFAEQNEVTTTISRTSGGRRAKKKQHTRPSWNNDFTDTTTTTDSRKEYVKSSETSTRRAKQKQQTRPSWNNDFTDTTTTTDSRKEDVASSRTTGRRAKQKQRTRLNRNNDSQSRTSIEKKRPRQRPRPRQYAERSSDSMIRNNTARATLEEDRPINVGKSKEIMSAAYPTESDTELRECPCCHRRFNPVSHQKHVKICRKPRRVKRFDAASKRAQAIAESNNISQARAKQMVRKSTHSSRSSSSAKWRQQSNALRDALRSAREYTNAKRLGRPVPAMTSTYSEPNGYIPCPHCGRTFSENAGKRHIPHCKKSKSRRRVGGGFR